METVSPMTSRRRMIWIASTFLIACVLTIGTVWIARRAVGADTETLTDLTMQMAASRAPAGSNADPARMEAMRPFMRRMVQLYPVMIPFGMFVSTVVLSAVLYGAYRLAGARLTLLQVVAACTTGAAARAAVHLCITLIVVFVLKKPLSAESLLDGSFVSLDASAFLPAETGPVLVSLASRISLLWITFAVGFVAYLTDEEGLEKISGKIIGTLLVCYAIWAVIAMAWAAL